MGLDIKTIAIARKRASQNGGNGDTVSGKNVIISSITPIDGGNRITFSYTLDDGTNKTSDLDVMNGKDGQAGENGIGITKIEKIQTDGLIDTYKITFSDGEPFVFEIVNGEHGKNCDPQKVADILKKDTDFLDSVKGEPGEDGNPGEPVDFNETVNAVKNEIRRGYQTILDEEIDYAFCTSTPAAVTVSPNLVVPLSVINTNNMELDNNCLKLKSGKIYVIEGAISINGSTASVIDYVLYNATKGTAISNTGRSNNVASYDSYSEGNIINTFINTTEDTLVTLKIVANTNSPKIRYATLSAFELKQPVVTNVSVDDFIKDAKENNQDAPVGNVIAYMGTEAPKHYLPCDGSIYSILNYPQLADHFKDSLGSYNFFGGDGINTFAVPDLRGEFLRGTGTNSHQNQGNGANVGSHQDATTVISMQRWTDNTLITGTVGQSLTSRNADVITQKSTGNRAFIKPDTISSPATEPQGLMSVRPTNTSVLYCIKYEPTYFLKVGAGTDGTSIDEIVRYLKDNDYITEKITPTKAEIIGKIIDTLDAAGYLVDEPIDDKIDENGNPINPNIPAKREQAIVFLSDSDLFDDIAENQVTVIPVAIQALKDAGILGEYVEVDNLTEDISKKLKTDGFLDGYAKESYVDKAIKNHTKNMGDEIRNGYQKILDEDIAYLNAVVVVNNSITTNLLFKTNDAAAHISNHGFDIDNDGYIVLKAGHLYNIHPNVMIGKISVDVGYYIIDKSGNKIVSDFWAETGNYSDATYPVTIVPDKDISIAMKLSKNEMVYQYSISIHELKTPVYTNVELDSYIDHIDHASEDTPVGHIISYMGNNAPTHYLNCDGTEYNIADYPYLVNHFIKEFGLSNYFGGDGISTFAVPDLRGEFLRGSGTAVRDSGSGAAVGEHQEATRVMEPCIDSGVTHIYIPRPWSYSKVYADKSGVTFSDGTNTVGRTRLNADASDAYIAGSGGRAMTSRPTNTSVMYCIKAEPTRFIKFNNPVDEYTYDEKFVGYWYNGKSLYEKSIDIGSIVSGTSGSGNVLTKTIPHGIPNIDTIIIHGGFVHNPNSKTYTPISVIAANNINVSWRFVIDATNIHCYVGKDVQDTYNATVILRYTKN